MFLVMSLIPNNAMFDTFKILWNNSTYLSLLIISTVANLIGTIMLNRLRRVIVYIIDMLSEKALPSPIKRKGSSQNNLDELKFGVRIGRANSEGS